ncbi:MAG: DUF502 domain-containing protein [Haloarculaceae archaeon]
MSSRESGADSPVDPIERLREALLTGLAIALPVFVTLLVLGFVIDFLTGVFAPVVAVVDELLGLDPGTRTVVLYGLTTAIMLLLIVVVGLVANTETGSRIEATFNEAIARIPAIGSVYTSFDQMSEILFDNDADSFKEVVLVEYPTEGSYALAFVTANPRDEIAAATGHEDVTTVFVPMAPNPVMGGFVLQVSAERCHKVDLTVEEGVQAIVTSGVALADVPNEEVEPIELSESFSIDLSDRDPDSLPFDIGDRDADSLPFDLPSEQGREDDGADDAAGNGADDAAGDGADDAASDGAGDGSESGVGADENGGPETAGGGT